MVAITENTQNIQIFSNKEFGSIRSLMINGEPYFVGKDVTDILGYQNGSRDVNRHVDEEDRQKIMVFDGNQDKETIIINESGLYSLILSSKLPAAKKFKRWVTSEVLPAIRKHGVFVMDDIINNTDALIEALQAFKAEKLKRQALEVENAIQRQQIAEMEPKVSYYDKVLQSPDPVKISIIAKDYGYSAKNFNQLLKDLKVQYKQGNIWLLYQKYAGNGYTQTKTHAYDDQVHGCTGTSCWTYWTQKGDYSCTIYLKRMEFCQKQKEIQIEMIQIKKELIFWESMD